MNGEGLHLHLSRHCSSSRKVSSLLRPYDRLQYSGDLRKTPDCTADEQLASCTAQRRYPSIKLSLTWVTGHEANQSVWSQRVCCVTVRTWLNHLHRAERLPASPRHSQVIRRMTRPCLKRQDALSTRGVEDRVCTHSLWWCGSACALSFTSLGTLMR
jgi:hypothetical protein